MLGDVAKRLGVRTAVLRPSLVVSSACVLLGFIFLVSVIGSASLWVVEGDTSSLEGGQVFRVGFGAFTVCDNVRSGGGSQRCSPITDAAMTAVARTRSVTNYIDRSVCGLRPMSAAAPYFVAVQSLALVALLASLVGLVIATLVTLYRPPDVAVFANLPELHRRLLYSPCAASIALWATTWLLVVVLAIYVFFFQTWVFCGESFCDVCRYAQDCVCGYGAGFKILVITAVLHGFAALVFGARWFQLKGGSSAECLCRE